MTVAENIKKLRMDAGYTQRDFAKRLGVAPTTVSAWELGRAKPLMNKLSLMAKLFNVPVSSIASDPIEEHMYATNDLPITKERRNAIAHGLESFKDVPSSDKLACHYYPYFPSSISAGELTTVDPVTLDDVQQVALSDAVMNQYSGDKDIMLMRVNGESMNNVIPDQSLIAVKRVSDVSELRQRDIVVFSEGKEDYSVKRFYPDAATGSLVFKPDSTDPSFEPIIYNADNTDDLYIIGRVVVYVVTL